MPPDLDQQEQLSLTDAIRDSLDTSNETQQPQGEVTDSGGKPAAAAPALPPEAKWEAPPWTAKWKPEARDALGRFAAHPEMKQYLDPVTKQLEEINGYTTKRDQEFAEYRRRTDPIYSILAPYEQRYRLQGQTLEQGVSQLIGAAEFLGNDPDQAFPWLAQTYRPRDPAAALQQLAQSWGVDIESALQDAPYVDPTVSAMLTPLQQELASMRSYIQQQQVGQQQQVENALLGEIHSFENAKDEQGNPLHPHFAAVFDDMVTLVQMGRAKDLPTAYKMATQYNPDLQSASQAEAAEKARQKALAEASTRSESTSRIERASRNVGGKGRAQPNINLSIKEGYEAAVKALDG